MFAKIEISQTGGQLYRSGTSSYRECSADAALSVNDLAAWTVSRGTCLDDLGAWFNDVSNGIIICIGLKPCQWGG